MSMSSELYRIEYHFRRYNPLDRVFEQRVEEIYSKVRPTSDFDAMDMFNEKMGKPADGLIHYKVIPVGE